MAKQDDTGNRRHKDMRTVSKKVFSHANKLTDTPNQFSEIGMELLLERIYKLIPKIRSYFTKIIHDYIEECAKKEGIKLKINPLLFKEQLPMIAEAVMTLLYYHNHRLDVKCEVVGKGQIDLSNFQENILRRLINVYVLKNIPAEQACTVLLAIDAALDDVNKGQMMDKAAREDVAINSAIHSKATLLEDVVPISNLKPIQNIVHDLKQKLPQEKQAIEFYFRRLYLISSSLFKHLAKLVMELCGYDGKEKENIIAFAESYGFIMQLVNDNADFIFESKTAAKQATDVLSDLKNRSVTLPILVHLNKLNNKGIIKAYWEEDYKELYAYLNVQQKPLSKDRLRSQLTSYHNEIFREVILSGALEQSIKVGKSIAQKAKIYINPAIESGKNLLSMLEIADNNRYYHHFWKARKIYKKSPDKLYKCEENLSINKENKVTAHPKESKRKAA